MGKSLWESLESHERWVRGGVGGDHETFRVFSRLFRSWSWRVPSGHEGLAWRASERGEKRDFFFTIFGKVSSLARGHEGERGVREVREAREESETFHFFLESLKSHAGWTTEH